MRVTGVDCHVLVDPAYERDATSSNQDTIVVEVHTDENITGIGETDLNAWVARACIQAPGTHTMDVGLGESLIGMDPLDPEAVWDHLYVGTAMTGRRGALVHALGAIDMALWDIAGKAAGVPTWQLLGDAAHETFTPYASLLPRGGDFDTFSQTLVDQATWAAQLGFRACKLEILITGPYAHEGLDMPSSAMADILMSMGILPSRTSDIEAHQDALATPFLASYVDALAAATPFPTVLGGPAATDALQRQLEALINGQVDAATAMETAAKDVDAALAAAQ